MVCIFIRQICAEAGLPPGVFNVVTGSGAMGSKLATHPDVDKVAFTGSTEVFISVLHEPRRPAAKGAASVHYPHPPNNGKKHFFFLLKEFFPLYLNIIDSPPLVAQRLTTILPYMHF